MVENRNGGVHMVVGRRGEKGFLTEDEIRETVEKGIPTKMIEGKRVLVLTPDGTRTAPLPMMVKILQEVIGGRAARIDFMVALGTHRPLSEREIFQLYGIGEKEREVRGARSAFLNHRWDLERCLIGMGIIEARTVQEITEGQFNEDIPVEINRRVFAYDLIVILGPVFPHEVVGFSGGYKYLFPGISGGVFLHIFHWLGAINTCMETIGRKYTPTQRIIRQAAKLFRLPLYCISMVVTAENRLAGLFVGDTEESWSKAADLSEKLHIVHTARPFRLVIGSASKKYDELWTAGKVMYKLEPVVADGGTLIIHGSHISTISHSWGRYLERIGYHVRDYYLSRMHAFADIPKAVLAHSTHVKGLGTYADGKETPRIHVVLATAIPERVCRKINLGYMNPADVPIDTFRDQEILFVEEAGEVLYRIG